jgi:4-hydroxy-tetrahydrodipicolinate synthase
MTGEPQAKRQCTGKPQLQLRGAFTALVTPFTADGKNVDFETLGKNVEYQIKNGIDGLVPVGTTGECPTLSHEEHDKVIEHVIKTAAGRVPVIAGTGSNATDEAVRLTARAKESGATAALIVNPYYNKPNQKGLFEHFKAIAAVGIPIVLYNIPGRTGITMSPATVAALYKEVKEIVAIKEATGSLDQASEIAALCDIQILSGDDSLTLPLMSVGGSGVVSVLSNVDPTIVKAITEPALKGDYDSARKAHVKMFKLARSMFCEVNPQPIKCAMHALGLLPTDKLRLPLVSVTPENRAQIVCTLVESGIQVPLPDAFSKK